MCQNEEGTEFGNVFVFFRILVIVKGVTGEKWYRGWVGGGAS